MDGRTDYRLSPSRRWILVQDVVAARWRLYRSAGLAAEPVTLPDSTQEGVRFDPTEHFICGFADATPPTH